MDGVRKQRGGWGKKEKKNKQKARGKKREEAEKKNVGPCLDRPFHPPPLAWVARRASSTPDTPQSRGDDSPSALRWPKDARRIPFHLTTPLQVPPFSEKTSRHSLSKQLCTFEHSPNKPPSACLRCDFFPVEENIRPPPPTTGRRVSHLITVLLHVLLSALEDFLRALLRVGLHLSGGGSLLGGPRLIALATLKSGFWDSGLQKSKKRRRKTVLIHSACSGQRRDATRRARAPEYIRTSVLAKAESTPTGRAPQQQTPRVARRGVITASRKSTLRKRAFPPPPRCSRHRDYSDDIGQRRR